MHSEVVGKTTLKKEGAAQLNRKTIERFLGLSLVTSRHFSTTKKKVRLLIIQSARQHDAPQTACRLDNMQRNCRHDALHDHSEQILKYFRAEEITENMLRTK
jgi:exopolyphosphatase/pppGpp-phosphohydrolase